MRIAVFASHGGSNLQSLIDACESGRIDGKVVLVVCNNRKAYALERAANHGVPALVITDKDFADYAAYASAMLAALDMAGVELICLAGYMKKIPDELIRKYHRRVVNIHPALLPKFGGKGMYGIHVHEAVLAAGETETGVSIHLVDSDYDHGRIISQRRVAVLPGDTPESLQQRVLEIEHELYPETVARIASGELKLE